MICRGLMFLLIFLLPFSTFAAVEITQREWMAQLTDSLGWAFGLPDEPEDEDYLQLFAGERVVRLEAETDHLSSDLVAVKRYTNFGEYSGEGWVSGLIKPTKLHLRFLLRHKGRYKLAVASRMPGLKIQLAGQEYSVDGQENITRKELGEVDLTAGQIEIVVILPPQGGIDYIELIAPSLPRISPLGGWQPDQPITVSELALTAAQALNLQAYLPLVDKVKVFEAETVVTSQDGVYSSRDRHLGTPSGNAWLRSGNQHVKIAMPVRVTTAGCYQFTLRGSSDEAVSIELEGLLSDEINFGHALKTVELGYYCLPKQTLELKIDLPQWAGIDMFGLARQESSAANIVRLLGLPVEPVSPDRELVNELLELISSLTY